MIYTTCLMCYASFSYSRPIGFRIFLAIFLASLAVFITLYYHYLQDPVFHQNTYAFLTTVVILRSMHTMEVALRPRWRHSREEDRLAREKQGLPVPTREVQEYENARDVKTLKTMWFMVAYGLFMFLGGFFIWNMDNTFCSKLRGWRQIMGLPWGILLEGHGWWYVLFPAAAYRPNIQLQAPRNRYWSVSIHYLGHLATTLPQSPPGGVLPVVAALLEFPRGRPKGFQGQGGQWVSQWIGQRVTEWFSEWFIEWFGQWFRQKVHLSWYSFVSLESASFGTFFFLCEPFCLAAESACLL